MNPHHNLSYVGILILAWVVADLLFPLIISLSRRLGAVDRPSGHKRQAQPVPYLGGIGICCALSVAVLATLSFDRIDAWLPLAGIPVGGLVVLVVGLLDDWRPVNAVVKLLIIFVASLIVLAFGVRATLLPAPWGILPNLVLSMLWIAGITSALNSIDNTDGAAGGVTAVAAAGVCAAYLVRNGSADQPSIMALSCALMGACFGFLRYNWPRARIYLGDNGSFFLGFTLASMLLFAKWTDNPLRSAIIPWVLVTVPVLDLVLSTALRYYHGVVRSLREAIVHCGHDHLSHRLQALGMSRAGSSVVLWSVGGVAAAETITLCEVRSDLLFWAVLAGHVGLVAIFSAMLARAPVYQAAPSSTRSGEGNDGATVLPVRNLQTQVHSRLPVLLPSAHDSGPEDSGEQQNGRRAVELRSAR